MYCNIKITINCTCIKLLRKVSFVKLSKNLKNYQFFDPSDHTLAIFFGSHQQSLTGTHAKFRKNAIDVSCELANFFKEMSARDKHLHHQNNPLHF